MCKGADLTNTFKSQILLFNPVNDKPVPLASESSILLSSANSPWKNITLEQQRLPANETPFLYLKEHTISFHLKPAKVLEWQFDGSLQSGNMIPKDIFFVGAGVPVKCSWEEEVEVFNLSLTPDFVTQVAEESVHTLRPVEFVSQVGRHDPQIWYIALALKAELEAGYPSGELFSEALATALAVHMLKNYNTYRQPIANVTSGLFPLKLRRVIAYIHDHLQKNLTLSELANVAGLSSHYFRHQFKQSTGLAPYQYLLHCRIEKAKELIMQRQDLTIAQIATQVGFSDQSHLSYHTKRLLGVTPKTIRKNSS